MVVDEEVVDVDVDVDVVVLVDVDVAVIELVDVVVAVLDDELVLVLVLVDVVSLDAGASKVATFFMQMYALHCPLAATAFNNGTEWISHSQLPMLYSRPAQSTLATHSAEQSSKD